MENLPNSSIKKFHYEIMSLQQSFLKQIGEAIKTSRTQHSWVITNISHTKVIFNNNNKNRSHQVGLRIWGNKEEFQQSTPVNTKLSLSRATYWNFIKLKSKLKRYFNCGLKVAYFVKEFFSLFLHAQLNYKQIVSHMQL